MPTPITASEIKIRVLKALEELFDLDCYLLQNDLNECSINHKLACHLQNQFQEWHVDCEYNKDGDKVKSLEFPNSNVEWNDTNAKSVYPDIIVHRRGNNGPNLLVIEIKKSSNKSKRDHDYNKLEGYVQFLSYYCALFLEIGTKENVGKRSFDWIKLDDYSG